MRSITSKEQKVFWRAVAAGALTGVVLGLLIALFIAMKPQFLAGLIR